MHLTDRLPGPTRKHVQLRSTLTHDHSEVITWRICNPTLKITLLYFSVMYVYCDNNIILKSLFSPIVPVFCVYFSRRNFLVHSLRWEKKTNFGFSLISCSDFVLKYFTLVLSCRGLGFPQTCAFIKPVEPQGTVQNVNITNGIYASSLKQTYTPQRVPTQYIEYIQKSTADSCIPGIINCFQKHSTFKGSP